MKSLKSILALILALVMALALFGCSSKQDDSSPSAPEASSPASPSTDSSQASPDSSDVTEEYPSYSIGFGCLGTGIWIADMHEHYNHYFLEGAGMDYSFTSCNFNSDQMVKDLQNFITSGIDGYMYFGAFGTLAPTVTDLLDDAQVYWANFDQPIQEEVRPYVHASPYFCGEAFGNNELIIADLAQKALDMGYRKAAMIGGAIGDTVADIRLGSFQKTFEAGGGEVVAVARCSDPSEAAQKSDDLVAAYGHEIDCFYCINMDFNTAALNAMENYGIEGVMCFSSDTDADGLKVVKKGLLLSQSCVNSVEACAANALLINALDGHKILDESGEAPEIDCAQPWTITPETADDYQKYWLEQEPISIEEFNNLLYRNNPNVTYEDIYNFVANYNYENVMASK